MISFEFFCLFGGYNIHHFLLPFLPLTHTVYPLLFSFMFVTPFCIVITCICICMSMYCICILYIHTYIVLNITCPIYILLVASMFSGLTFATGPAAGMVVYEEDCFTGSKWPEGLCVGLRPHLSPLTLAGLLFLLQLMFGKSYQ